MPEFIWSSGLSLWGENARMAFSATQTAAQNAASRRYPARTHTHVCKNKDLRARRKGRIFWGRPQARSAWLPAHASAAARSVSVGGARKVCRKTMRQALGRKFRSAQLKQESDPLRLLMPAGAALKMICGRSPPTLPPPPTQLIYRAVPTKVSSERVGIKLRWQICCCCC
jgi:hypothetical protein